MRHAAICIHVDEPDYSDPDLDYDWSKTVYGEPDEFKPDDAPEPLGKHVTLTHYVDANLFHDALTGSDQEYWIVWKVVCVDIKVMKKGKIEKKE